MRRSKGMLSSFLLLVVLSWSQETPQDSTAQASSVAPSQITIPDGTLVRLRFAQPLRGKVPCLWKRPPCGSSVVPEAKAEDSVRMVAAADVRVGQYIVIAKGAVGQATVTKVWHPFVALTGMALRLDWVEDVTGKHVPLRIEKDGKQEPFTVQVESTTRGMIARRETLRGDLTGKDSVDASLIWRKKNWIPAGTRMRAFVQGSIIRDLAEIKDAQTMISSSDDIATLTVYRMKGREEDHPDVSCDGAEVAHIGAGQYAVADLAPGTHSCLAENKDKLEITAREGEDYFVQLKPSGIGGWSLKMVDAGEGEDSVIDLAPVNKNQN